MFNTHYDRTHSTPEARSGRVLVETAGYMSAEKRITNLLLAGQRLDSARKEAYDFPDGQIDEKFVDPTRASNYDIADAYQDSLDVNRRLEEAEKESKKESKKVDDNNESDFGKDDTKKEPVE